MAWEISMNAEGWDQVSRNVYGMTVSDLVEAIVDDEFEKATPDDIDSFLAARKQHYAGVPQDCLASHAMELIRENNTCDNGGHAVWIDKEGYQTVPVDLQDYAVPSDCVC